MVKFASWDEVLQGFRDLGGIADNICVKTIDGRRGIFPVNPGAPFKLFIPERAIIPVDDVETVDGKLLLKQSSGVSPEVRSFFNAYHAFTSWTGGGRESVEDFLVGLQKLPEPVKNQLSENFYFAKFLEKPSEEHILARFIATRQMTFKENSVLFPLLELTNHAPVHAGFVNTDSGVSLDGTSQGEIFVRYGLNDSWMRYKSFGFPIRERWAFSDPFNVTPKDGSMKIAVRNAVDECVHLPEGLIAPEIKRDGNSIDISFLIIGDRVDPSVPTALYRKFVKHELGQGSEEFFETLSYINRLKFLELLRTCEGHTGKNVTDLKAACHYQLECLNNIWFGTWATG